MSSEQPGVSRIDCRVDGAVGRLTLDNQAKQNALSFDMWASLPGLVRQLDDDPSVRVIVIEGAGGKAFASGSDISQFGEKRNNPENVKLYNATVDQAIASVAAAAKPTLARVRGWCFGGGVALALHCDLRYAAEGATFCIPAGKVGVGYHELWLQRLGWMVGPANAKEIMFTARRYDAAEAFRMGLVNRVVDDEAFGQVVDDICGLAPLTHAASKTAIDAGARGFDQGREASQQAILRCFSSQDYIEGRDAFTQKRKPAFTGK